MKEKIFLLSFILLSVCGWSQKLPVAKLYAYAQSVTPGARPQGAVTENGKEQPAQPVERVSYFLYAEQLRNSSIQFIAVWIKGTAYPANAGIVSSTPVEMTHGEGAEAKKIILAPATKNKLWIITPGSAIEKPAKPSATLQKLIANNELVLIYRWKGKAYYYPVKKIKKLPAVLAV